LRLQRSKALNDFIDAKDLVFLEVVVVVAIVEAVADLLQTLAENRRLSSNNASRA
jgi:hypothetical protein